MPLLPVAEPGHRCQEWLEGTTAGTCKLLPYLSAELIAQKLHSLPALCLLPGCSEPVGCWNYWSHQCQGAPRGLEECQAHKGGQALGSVELIAGSWLRFGCSTLAGSCCSGAHFWECLPWENFGHVGGTPPQEGLFSPWVAMSGWAEAEPQRSSEVPGHQDVTAATRMVPTSTLGESGTFLPALLVFFSLLCSFSSPCLAPLQQRFPLQSELHSEPFPWQDMNERLPVDNPRNLFLWHCFLVTENIFLFVDGRG